MSTTTPDRIPIPLAHLKHKLIRGREFYLINRERERKSVFGSFPTDRLKRTVERVQTNAIACIVEGQTALSWLYWHKGDKAYETRDGFILESPFMGGTLTFQWANLCKHCGSLNDVQATISAGPLCAACRILGGFVRQTLRAEVSRG